MSMFVSVGEGLVVSWPSRLLAHSALLAGLAVASLVALPGGAQAFCLSSTAGGESCCNPGSFGCSNFHWRQRCVSFGVEQSGSEDLPIEVVHEILDRAFDAWRNVECAPGQVSSLDVRRLRDDVSNCNVPEYNPDGGNINSIGFVSDWAARGNDPNAFALTSVFFDRTNGEIWDADMEVNQEALRVGGETAPLVWGVCPVPTGCDNSGQAFLVADLEATMTHEAGHFIGLGHTNDVLATMFASGVAGDPSGRFLSDDDRAGYCAAYPPGAPGGDCNFAPRGGLVTECGGLRTCGCSVVSPRDLPAPMFLSLVVTGILLRRRRS